MDLLYKGKEIDIYFDRENNRIIQKRKVYKINFKHFYDFEENEKDFVQNFNERVHLDLYHQPQEEIELELQIMLFHSYTHNYAQA